MKFYKCAICGNIISEVEARGGQIVCCGQPITELVAKSSELAFEKHVPVVVVEGNVVTVTVGSVPHPMLPEHHINWVAIQTTLGNQRKVLDPTKPAVVQFSLLPGEKIIRALEYCNLHGLWEVVL
ncbi:MAG: desulfoferrodoxin FeS4 iron-binding domain-containing protein [Bacillales bacterium]|jgi:superoxide reductase|nr:desulfoferrodoxin FeS4 iron-binding domain-containing protein [Bacillales bacterium]